MMIKFTLQQVNRINRLMVGISPISAMDDKWITVKPNGEKHKGTPVRISDDGRIIAGMGGKFNGEKINEVRKDFKGPKTPSSTVLEANKKNQNTSNSKPKDLVEKPVTSKRVERLIASLANKTRKFDFMLKNHFNDVKSANGQPLNDKRGGAAIMKRWDKQAQALNKQAEEIQKTKDAIERVTALEEKIAERHKALNLPNAISEAMQTGEITQWRKYPNRFFVKGVEKGRIIWDEKKGELLVSHFREVPDEQKETFRNAFNGLKEKLASHTAELAEKKAEKKKTIPQSAYLNLKELSISEILQYQKKGMKFSRTKRLYYFPKGIEMPEELKKYAIDSLSVGDRLNVLYRRMVTKCQ